MYFSFFSCKTTTYRHHDSFTFNSDIQNPFNSFAYGNTRSSLKSKFVFEKFLNIIAYEMFIQRL